MNASSSSPVFRTQTTTGVDVNASTTTTFLDIQGTRDVAMNIIGTIGSHTTHVIKVQTSADNANWANTGIQITGTGVAEGAVNTKYIRAKVTTLEGSGAQVTIVFNVK